VVFERAYAASSFTLASLTGFVTGRPPGQVSAKILRKKAEAISDEIPVLFERFEAAGFRTAVINELDEGGSTLWRRGVKTYAGTKHRFDQTAPEAVRLLDGFGADPFLLLVYFEGPHAPYAKRPGAPDFGDDMVDLYDSELAATDERLGMIVERVAAPDLADRVAVVVVSDHGEAFGEHGAYYHGKNMFDETIRIPMIMRVPTASPKRLGQAPVSLIDVGPTLLSLAGLPPLEGAQGHDLSPGIFEGRLDLDRHVFIEAIPPRRGYQAAVVTRQHKLIEEAKARSFALYDLAADPGETRDISGIAPEQFVALRKALATFKSLGKPHDAAKK
jgi:arylsulfatase A-like enzyme